MSSDTTAYAYGKYGETREVLGVPVNALRLDDVISIVDDTICSGNTLHIGVVNGAKIVNMNRNAVLQKDVLASDIILADGISVVWASKFLGQTLPVRVTGIDLMFSMLELAHRNHYRVYCLGATEEVSCIVAQKIAEDFPNAVVAGRRNGYFSKAEQQQVALDIAAAKPDILFVAMTSPKKEIFMADWANTMSVKVIHGVGGSFDVMSGKVARAPAIWQKLGLEWLYRVQQEPGRLWRRYLVTNSLFCAMVLKALITRIFPHPKAK